MILLPERVRMEGYFKLTIRDGETLKVKRELDWFPNLILDQGLNRFGTDTIAGWCQVGTNNTTPNVLQTALVARVAGTSSVQDNLTGGNGASPYYVWFRKRFRFGVGAAAGNLSEVGVGWATSGSLWCRALIVDNMGVPTTITVLSTEVLDVTYELRVYQNEADVAFDIQIGPTLHSCVMRPAMINSWGSLSSINNAFSGWNTYDTAVAPYAGVGAGLGPITGNPTGTQITSSDSYVADAYSNNSYKRKATYTFGLTSANSNIAVVTHNSMLGKCQVSFSPPIPKTNTKVLTLSFERTWARHVP